MINAEVAYDLLSAKVDEEIDDEKWSYYLLDLHGELSDICSGAYDLDNVIGRTAKVSKDGFVTVVFRNTFKANMKKVRFLVEDYYYNEYTIEINDWPRLEKKEVSFYCVMEDETLEYVKDGYYFSMVEGSLEIELADKKKQADLEEMTTIEKPKTKADNVAVDKSVQAPTTLPEIKADNVAVNKIVQPTTTFVEKSVSTKVNIAEENGKHVIEYPEYNIKCEGLEGYEDTLKLAEAILAEITLNNDSQPPRGSLDYQKGNKDKHVTGKEETVKANIEDYQNMLKSQAGKTYLEFETTEEAKARVQQPTKSSLDSQNTSSGCMTTILIVISVVSTLAFFVTY